MKLFTLLFAFATLLLPSDGPRITQEPVEFFDLSSMSLVKAIWVHVSLPDDDKTADHVQVTITYLQDGRQMSVSKTVERPVKATVIGAMFPVPQGFQGVQAITAVCQTLSGKSATVTYR